jgi:hypothetical protein
MRDSIGGCVSGGSFMRHQEKSHEQGH